MPYSRDQLRQQAESIQASDPDLFQEIQRVARSKDKPKWLPEVSEALSQLSWDRERPAVEGVMEGLASAAIDPNSVEYESIILRYGRPVLALRSGQPKLVFEDPDSETWRTRLTNASDYLRAAAASIGRIEVSNHPSGFPYMGTGWVIDDGVIVTNRHVALTFAERGDQGFTFSTGFDRKNPIGVDIDFIEEIDNVAASEYAISRVLYIARDDEPDIAFLEYNGTGRPPLSRIETIPDFIPKNTMVAIIGYPARDSRVTDLKLMDRIFGGIYDKKRLAPGFAVQISPDALNHDCTTLGGNSGSPIIDLATGKVCGLHFSGMFLKTNYAIPASVVATMLRRLRNNELLVPVIDATGKTKPPMSTSNADNQQLSQGTEVKFTIPLEITVRLGQPDQTPRLATATTATAAPSPSVTPSTAPAVTVTDRPTSEAALVEAKRLLGGRLDIANIELGWKFRDGWITNERAIVVHVHQKKDPTQLEALGLTSLPKFILNVPVDVQPAPLRLQMVDTSALEAAKVWQSPYKPWAEAPLEEVNEEMKLTAHLSPDAGWGVLSKFLGLTKKRLTIGMYDFTAPHIVKGVKDATKPRGRSMTLVLQRGEDIGKGTKKDDISDSDTVEIFHEALKNRFAFAWASVRSSGALFKSAYHIKVAVRDGAAFWLSSGNWQSSNQPPFDPINGADTSPSLLTSRNREWHVVVENTKLADIFEKYLQRDEKQASEQVQPEAAADSEPMVWVSEDFFQASEVELEARPQYFKPMEFKKKLRVQPLLTPDNYAEQVLAFIKSATSTIYFQNQSFKTGKAGSNPEHFEKLLQALLQKQRDGLDVRIILRKIGDLFDIISDIKDYGFDMDRVRLQTNCHTKGIVIDARAVLIGSQNWTGDGTGPNRDASLIIYDSEVAEYFQRAFLYDWTRIGKPKIDETLPAPELATGQEIAPPPRMILMPLNRWLGES